MAATTNPILSSQCKECFIKTYQRIANRLALPGNIQDELWSYLNHLVAKNGISSPEIQRELSLKLSSLTGISDFFEAEKQQSNALAAELYADWKPRVLLARNPLNIALRLSIAGNIMDYGANSSFSVTDSIGKALMANFAIDHSKELFSRIKSAKNILFLGDNAGEIVFDKLLIEVINQQNITYVVRGGNALNDATLTDATDVGLTDIVPVISNGFNAPSTLLTKCSDEFKNAYQLADLIIAKGQGNLEGLLVENDPRIFFLLMVKCNAIAKALGVEKGSFIVANKLLVKQLDRTTESTYPND